MSHHSEIGPLDREGVTALIVTRSYCLLSLYRRSCRRLGVCGLSLHFAFTFALLVMHMFTFKVQIGNFLSPDLLVWHQEVKRPQRPRPASFVDVMFVLRALCVFF